jgi:alpha-tubulin suppressor-like RCC1 family protein
VGISDAAQVAVGVNYACALWKAGNVTCWGSAQSRTLGLGDAGYVAQAGITVPFVDGVKATSSAGATTCALRTNGRLLCWGTASYGALGKAVPAYYAAWGRAVDLGFEGVAQVGHRDGHSCVLAADGRVLCRGANYYGELGNGAKSTQTVFPPVQVVGSNPQ